MEHYGYIYRITINNKESHLHGCTYVGQHKYYNKNTLDPKYFGSSTRIKNEYIPKYGYKGLEIKGIIWADSKERLNELEKLFILIERDINSKCLNVTNGGTGGMNIFDYLDEDAKQELSRRRTEQGIKYYQEHPEKREQISKRCKEVLNTPEVNKRIREGAKEYFNLHPEARIEKSIYMTEKYKNEDERKKTSVATQQAFNNNPNIGKKISEELKKCFEDPEYKKRHTEKTTGLYNWNNGQFQCKSKECPGPEWVRGTLYYKIPDDWKWYNNGKINIRYKECPEGFTQGRIKRDNGIVHVVYKYN